MFSPSRALLNPKFEGYKLSPLPHQSHVFRYSLERHVTQATASSSLQTRSLSFEEVQSRIRHNHLALGQGNRGLYIDEDLGVNLITLDGNEPVVKRICELPVAIQTDDISQQREYPSAVSLNLRDWIVADGTGRAYYITEQDEADALIAGSYHFVLDENAPLRPSRILSTTVLPDGVVRVLVVSRVPSPRSAKVNPSFEIHALDIPSPAQEDAEIHSIRPQWSFSSSDLPLAVQYFPEQEAFLVLSSAPFLPSGSAIPDISREPGPDEIAPIPRPDENLDKIDVPPYSWTQTSDSVTIAIPLPNTVTKADIKIAFSPKSLSVIIKNLPNQSDIRFPVPNYTLRELWASIDSSASLWTWEQGGTASLGLLMLYLEKSHEGTRWPQVFMTESPEVPETIDPSELANIRDQLEKFTVQGPISEGMDIGHGLSSLADGEMDEEVDSNVGRKMVTTWIKVDGSLLESKTSPPFDLLSTPIPTALPFTSSNTYSLVVKNTVDGVVFTHTFDSTGAPKWTHHSTFPAVAFVLATKRDTRFTYHVPEKAVFAFESGSSVGGNNVYIYRATDKPKEAWAKQAILPVTDGNSGSLLGIGAFPSNNGKTVVLCLCEREIIILVDVL
ncbi:CS-domain-containing protein [Sistotremastrum suecicum HHB10207 ss-3]|uniref:NudC domain-containing protein 1 n=1 Tax=Sistotremastrum suecicum HHB10207 ss-3 TaxID=1314776 RepID=A0A165ZJL7_9AGAM|nr:CS-domain-containing protein [Sistotremastrum suecicum HHB10207 ss-3]